MSIERQHKETASAWTAADRGMRLRFCLWSVGLAALLGVFLGVVLPHLKVETDIVALLPENPHDAGENRAVDRFSQALARKIIFLVGATEIDTAKDAATKFAATLRESGTFAKVDLEVNPHSADQLELYVEHRGSLLSARHADLLRSGQGRQLLDEALRAAYTPAGFARPLSLAADPLGLAADYLQQQVPVLGAAQLDGSMLTVTDERRSYILIRAELTDSPFSSSTQETAMAAIAAGRTQLGDAELLISGTVQHAAAIARRAQTELATFGAIEIAAVMALLLAVFGALRPLGLGAMTMGVAFLTGMTVTHLLFKQVHVLALVFGSSLIGGVIDYSIHFFADRFRSDEHWTPADAYRHVGGAIMLGLTTTLLSYLVLLVVPFPGLRQIAVFCIAGLIAGCGTVLCAYPILYQGAAKTSPLAPRAGRALLQGFNRWSWTPLKSAAAALLMAALCLGIARIQLQDDVRALQSSPPALVADEQRVSNLLRSALESRYFLVRAANPQALLETEERLTAALDGLIAADQLATYTAVTRALPSYRRQTEIQTLLATDVLGTQGLQEQAWTALGFDAAAIAKRKAEAAFPHTLLSPEDWLNNPASEPYRALWLGADSGQFTTIVTVGGIKNLAALKDLPTRIEGINLIDRVAAVTEVLRSYRQALSWLLLAVYAGAGLLLARKFGWREAPSLLIPSAAASLATLGLFGWFGVPVNLFTLLALWLVLGLGVDYGIFLRHGRTAQSTAVLSVTLSATTTLLAFGLLAFSATPFIKSIGLSLLCSITLSWLFAMISCLTFRKGLDERATEA